MRNNGKVKDYDNGKKLTVILLQMVGYVIFNSVVGYSSYFSFTNVKVRT